MRSNHIKDLVQDVGTCSNYLKQGMHIFMVFIETFSLGYLNAE